MGNKSGRDLTQGSITKQIILFSLPLIGSMLLSLFFNTADTAVLGIFCGDLTVAGAGCNGALIELIIGLATGISVGANVIVARYLGAKDELHVRRAIGTSLVFGLCAGIVLMFVGYFGAETFQIWMGCDSNVLPYAVKYIKIYFLGVPIILLYNFVSSILRANGDSFHPMLYFAIGGVVNVGLNIFFVLVCNMDVEGVAIATVASQGVALVLAIRLLLKNEGMAKIEIKHLRFYKKELFEIIRIGIPCGIQSSLFSFTNVILQSFVNSFGASVMAAANIAGKLDAIVYYTGYGVGVSTLSIVSQNYGAKNMERVKKTVLKALVICFVGCLAIGGICFLVKDIYLDLMTLSMENKDAILDACNKRLIIMLSSYFLCGFMDIATYSLRGLGYSTISMFIVLICCACFRIGWSFIVLTNEATKSIWTLYLSYPISWALTTSVGLFVFFLAYRKKKRDLEIREKTRSQKIQQE